MFKARRLLLSATLLPIGFAVCWFVLSRAVAFSSSASFKATTTYDLVPTSENASGNPRSIALGDFNGDGRMDIVTANYSSSTVSVILANGDGTFGPAKRYTVGSFPRFVLARDFNKDGKLDLAVVNNNKSPGISILLGDGLGGFGPASGFLAGGSPECMTIADFNNDGNLDLAVVNSQTNNISVLFGNGAGSFRTPTSITVGSNPLFIVSGDFNGDSRPDLAVANSSSNNIQILSNDGSGGFSISSTIPVGTSPSAIAICECNGDTRLDLVVANRGSNNISLLIGTGGGNFNAPMNFATQLAPLFVLATDLNGDGKVDLAVANSNSNDLSILLGDDLGNFMASPNVIAGPLPQGLAADDFDADGKADLAVANSNASSVWIIHGLGDGSFLQAPTVPTGNKPFGSVVADFNKDGKPDIATANFGDNTISVLLGDGVGSFGPPANFAVGTNPRYLATADFNRDGNVDLVVGNSGANNVSVLLGNGVGGFGAASTLATPAQPSSVVTGDFNGDGKADIAVAADTGGLTPTDVTLLLGDGSGGFGAPKNITAWSNPRDLIVGDFNSDGKTDIAAATDSHVSIIMGNSSGTFSMSSSYQLFSNDGITTSQTTSLVLGDFNGDGKLDLIVGIASNFAVLNGNGDGTFQAPLDYYPSGTFSHLGSPVLVGDFNGDGMLDIAFAGTGVTVLTNNSGSFVQKDFAAGPQTFSVVAADFNGDGRPDLATTDGALNSVLVMLNSSSFAPQVPQVQFISATYTVAEGMPAATAVVTRTGDTSGTSTVSYATSDSAGANSCSVIAGLASSRCDYPTSAGLLQFAAGETSKTISVPIVDDSFAEGPEKFGLTLGNASGASLGSPIAATITITDNETSNGPNPVDSSSFFVRQHYLDFLDRQPDQSGLDFWIGQMTNCGSSDLTVCRVNVSGAFFLSIEFQQTGNLVYKMYKAAFGNLSGKPVAVTRAPFIADTQQIQSTPAQVIVGQGNWQAQLETNKQAFALAFVQRPAFQMQHGIQEATTYVTSLFANTGASPTPAETSAAVNAFNTAGGGEAGRAAALRSVAESASVAAKLNNEAFVLMQYFGYLQRNPYDPPEPTLDFSGFNFWLSKLNQFNGDFIAAEMVKAFISSSEYRQRFGP